MVLNLVYEFQMSCLKSINIIEQKPYVWHMDKLPQVKLNATND